MAQYHHMIFGNFLVPTKITVKTIVQSSSKKKKPAVEYHVLSRIGVQQKMSGMHGITLTLHCCRPLTQLVLNTRLGHLYPILTMSLQEYCLF